MRARPSWRWRGWAPSSSRPGTEGGSASLEAGPRGPIPVPAAHRASRCGRGHLRAVIRGGDADRVRKRQGVRSPDPEKAEMEVDALELLCCAGCEVAAP